MTQQLQCLKAKYEDWIQIPKIHINFRWSLRLTYNSSWDGETGLLDQARMQTSAKSNLWFQSGYHKTEVETDTGRHVLYTLGHDRAAAHESLSFKHISEKANQTKINLSNYITMLRT